MKTSHDVVIAGGGLAGATLALILRRWVPELRVAVVERFPLPETPDTGTYQPSYDARSTALAWGTAQIFESLGLWAEMSRHATPIRHIHVSERTRFGATRLHAEEHQQPALGFVADNRWLGQCLTAALRADSAIGWISPADVASVHVDAESALIGLDGGSAEAELRASLLVVADGGRSDLRERLGFSVSSSDYRQHALIANISTTKPHNFVAYERFTDRGPMALLPRGNPDRAEGQAALVWTLTEAEVADVQPLPDAAFLSQLQTRFGWRLGRFTQVGERHVYPLSLSLVQQPIRPRVVLVGNAAQSLHPVAGQGFNLAIRGLVGLAETLRDAVSGKEDIGSLSVLERYVQVQEPDRQRIIGLSDGLIRLFGDRSGPLEIARDAGLVAMDLMPGLRHWFTRYAMGIGGRRPVPPPRKPEHV